MGLRFYCTFLCSKKKLLSSSLDFETCCFFYLPDVRVSSFMSSSYEFRRLETFSGVSCEEVPLALPVSDIMF